MKPIQAKSFVCLSLALALSGARSQAQSVTLRLKPKPGTTFFYESIQETKGPQGTGTKGSSLMSMKVLSADAKSVRLQTTVDKVDFAQPGMEALKGMKTTMILTPLYKFVSMTSSGGGAMAASMKQSIEMAMKMAPKFPEKPIKVGDSWTMTFDFKELMDKMSNGVIKVVGDSIVEFKMTLARIESKGGRKLAVIKLAADDQLKVAANGQEMNIGFNFSGENSVDTATGMNVNTTSVVKQTMSRAQGSGTMTSTNRMRLLRVK